MLVGVRAEQILKQSLVYHQSWDVVFDTVNKFNQLAPQILFKVKEKLHENSK